MRILHVILELGIGGAEILLKDLAIYFKKKNIETTIIVLMHVDSHIAQFLIDNGIKVIYCPQSKKFSFRNVIFLLNHLKNNHYDIVHAHLTWEQYTLALINFFLKKSLPLIATDHNAVMPRRDNFFVKIFSLEKWMYNHYRKIICVTPDVYESLTAYLPSIKKKCKVIVNGINLQKFSADYFVDSRIIKPVILCIGTLCARKDQLTLVKAIKLMDGDVKLWLVGDGPGYAKIKNAVTELNLEDKVFLLGQSNEIPELIKQATIYVQPSRYEGFGIAILEAMAGGLPIVASNVNGLHELIDNVSLFFSVGNENELANIVNKIIHNPGLLKELSDKSQAKARQYSIEKTADLYIDTYKEVITKNKSFLDIS